MKSLLFLFLWVFCGHAFAVGPPAANAADDVPAFKSRLLAATTRHLNLLLGSDGTDASLKHFSFGDTGQDGAHAATPSASILSRLH